jgi:hypothetical protein
MTEFAFGLYWQSIERRRNTSEPYGPISTLVIHIYVNSFISYKKVLNGTRKNMQELEVKIETHRPVIFMDEGCSTQ